MLLRTPIQCETVIPSGEAYRSIFLDCMRTVNAGGYFRYDTAAQSGAIWLPGPGFVAIVIAVIALISIIMVLNNNEITARHKAGWILGMIFALPVFLPLYFILTPPSQEH